MIYIASPLTSDSFLEKEIRAAQVGDCCAYLMSEYGYVVFAPVAFGWAIQKFRNMPTDWEYWKKVCRAYISRCQTVAVLMLPGWRESTGIQEELKIAAELNIPVIYIDPRDYKMYINPLEGF